MARNKDVYEFLPAVLEVQETPPSPLGRIIVFTIILLFSIAVVWACIGEVNIVATAQGKIIPNGRVKIIQPLEIGTVREIHVHEGQKIRQGDLLIEIDATSSAADIRNLQNQYEAAQLDVGRFETLLTLVEQGWQQKRKVKSQLKRAYTAIKGITPQSFDIQLHSLQSEWNEYQSRVNALRSSIISREAEQAAVEDTIVKFEGTLPLITQRTESAKKMVDKKLLAKVRWQELEQQRIEQKQDLAAAYNRKKQLQSAIEEARQQKKLWRKKPNERSTHKLQKRGAISKA